MNSLSWLLYLADVLPAIATGLATLFGMGGGLITMSGGIAFIVANDTYYKEKIPGYKRYGWKAVTYGPLFIVMAIMTHLVPSRDTFYMIAASEVGEQIVKTPEAIEMFNDIKTIIKQKIKDEVK